MIRLLASVALAALIPAVSPAMAAAPARAETTTQLPRTVVPSHYDLTLTPNPDAMTFDGHVRITVDVVKPTDRIVLNAADLSFGAVVLETGAGKAFGTATTAVDAHAQTATFTFAKAIPAGRYTLDASYKGKIYTQAAGLFALDYDGADGKQRALYTQFENSDARRMLPSWDEPAYKATFSLKANVPAGQMAVSNMPITASSAAPGGGSLVTFGTSPRMSTYLLFFGMGDFDRNTKMSAGAEVGVITKKGDIAKADFALQSAADILPWYNDYFGTAYPLPKLDNIAGPGRSQFFGAMENWGAIFYFESVMLLDPAFSTEADKQGVFSVVAHEMAHQWFGDLVTMSWWDDLWLNEGFASWMEGRASEHFHPEWNSELAAIGGRDGAMGLDALATTHPVVQHVETVEQASQAFDAITYQKGEAVIRMLEAYTGSDAWREGVRRYMKAHAHGSTVTDDLWKEMEAAAGKPITAIAHDFTLQPGVPLIRVESATCDASKTMLTLTQGEFSKDQPNKTPLSWQVPVIAKAIGGANSASTLVTGGKATLSVDGCAPVVVNAGQSGYYRTLYTPAQFAALASRFAAIAPADQLGLMADSSALGFAGLQPASNGLDLVEAIPADALPQVWQRAAGILGGLYGYSDGNPTRQAALQKLATARLGPVLDRLGWTPRQGESDNEAILRNTLIGVLGGMGDPAVVAEARRRYAASSSDPAAIPGSLLRTVLGIVALNADEATWNALHARAQAEKSALIKQQLYGLLSSTRDKALAQRALDLALTDEPGQTTGAAMIARVANQFPDMAFDFAVAHGDAVEAKIDNSARTRYFPGLAAGSYDPAMPARIDAYAAAKIPADARRSAETAKAAIQYRIKVRTEQMPQIDAWLRDHKG